MLQEENQRSAKELQAETAARNAISRDLFLLTNQLEKLEGVSTKAARSLKNQITELSEKLDTTSPISEDDLDSSEATEAHGNHLSEV